MKAILTKNGRDKTIEFKTFKSLNLKLKGHSADNIKFEGLELNMNNTKEFSELMANVNQCLRIPKKMTTKDRVYESLIQMGYRTLDIDNNGYITADSSLRRIMVMVKENLKKELTNNELLAFTHIAGKEHKEPWVAIVRTDSIEWIDVLKKD